MSEDIFIPAEKADWYRVDDPRFIQLDEVDFITSAISSQVSLHSTRLEPGGESKPHTHQTQVNAFYIVSGTGLATSQGETQRWRAGDFAWFPPGVEHGVKNDGDEPLVMFEVFTPPLM